MVSFCSGEYVCLSLLRQRQPFGWMSLCDELFLDNAQCANRQRKEEENKVKKNNVVQKKGGETRKEGGE